MDSFDGALSGGGALKNCGLATMDFSSTLIDNRSSITFSSSDVPAPSLSAIRRQPGDLMP